MNCKWAEKWELENARETTVWLCKSPKREDVLCGHCCLDCSRPFHYDGEVLGCLGVCEAARSAVMGEERAPSPSSCRACSSARSAVMGEERKPVGYWDATGCGRWVE